MLPILDDIEELRRRFSDLRPGADLLAVEDAALPVTVIDLDVLALERKPLPLLYEYILRLATSGVTAIEDLAGFCGLSVAIVEGTVADAASAGDITYNPSTRRVALTPRGVNSARELESIQPSSKRLSLPFDRMLWSLVHISPRDLITKTEATDGGLLLLPASKSAKITSEDISVQSANNVLRASIGKAAVEILTIRKVTASKHRYLPVKLLVFGDAAGSSLDISLVVDDKKSVNHDLILAGLGGPDKLGLSRALLGTTPDEAAESRVIIAPEDLRAAETSGEGSPAVRSIGVFEHPLLLRQATMQARRRLLIVSPWVKRAVVDTNFIGNLERRLRSGCVVHVAHGYGNDDSGSDRQALDRLDRLRQRFPEKFTLARLANTHAKILIVDDWWVTTSFNWLSFRGDEDRTYRMEEGTLVEIPKLVSAEYDKYVSMIEEHRIS
jgi:hypothetical protein